MWVLNNLASSTGDTNQRLAAHVLEALYCRNAGGKEAAATYVRPLHHQEETWALRPFTERWSVTTEGVPGTRLPTP